MPFFAYILSDTTSPWYSYWPYRFSILFLKFIRKYFEAYTSIVWSKHNLSIVCPFSDITIGGILGKCNINFVAKRVFALACCRRLDSGDGAKKSEQEKTGGWGGVPSLLPLPFFYFYHSALHLLPLSTIWTPWKISVDPLSCWTIVIIFFYFNPFTPGNFADQRKGRWVVGHGNFQGNVSWFFAFFSGVLDWIVLNLVWFERSLHSVQVSEQSRPWTLK